MKKLAFVVATLISCDLRQAAAHEIKLIGALRHGYDEAGITVPSVAFSPDGKTLASALSRYRDEGEVILWDISTKKKIGIVGTFPSYVTAVAYSPDGKSLAVAHRYGVRVIDTETRETRQDLLLEGLNPIEPIGITPDSKVLAACTSATLFVFDLATGREKGRLASGGKSFVSSFVAGPPSFTSDGKLMVLVRDDKVQVWDMTTMMETKSFPVRRGHSAAISPDGTLIAIGTNGSRRYPGVKAFVIRDSKTGEDRLHIGDFAPNSPVFTPNGRLLVFGSSLRPTKDYKDAFAQLGLAKKQLQAAVADPNAVDEKALQKAREATQKALNDMHELANPINVFDVTTGKVLDVVDGPMFFRLATNGSLIASANYDGTISLWDISVFSARAKDK